MDYAEFAQNISFRLLQPGRPRPTGFRALDHLARRAGIHLEMWMTALPEGQEQMQKRLRRVCRLPKRSTFAIAALINRGVSQMPPGACYLALGIDRGFPLFAGMAGHRDRTCIGVDAFCEHPARREYFQRRFLRWKSQQHEFHDLPGVQYLERFHQGAVGFCVCDGNRDYGEQLALLRAVEPHLSDGAPILIDDANRPEVRRAAADFVEHSPFHYRVLLDVQTPSAGHPTFWNGVLLIARDHRLALPAAFTAPERRAA